MSSLLSFIGKRHIDLDLSLTGAHEIFTSKKQFTRQVNFPKRMDLNKMIRLAQRIDVPPMTLLKKYGAGHESLKKCLKTLDTVDQVGDLNDLRKYFKIKPTTALRDEITTATPFSPAPAP